MATLHLMHDDVVPTAPINEDQVDLRNTDELALADDFDSEDEGDWGCDPAALAERREQLLGLNCFGRPIN